MFFKSTGEQRARFTRMKSAVLNQLGYADMQLLNLLAKK